MVIEEPELAHNEPGIKIKPANVELEEDGVRIALTVVDTPGAHRMVFPYVLFLIVAILGFGDNVNNEFAYVHSLPFTVCRPNML